MKKLINTLFLSLLATVLFSQVEISAYYGVTNVLGVERTEQEIGSNWGFDILYSTGDSTKGGVEFGLGVNINSFVIERATEANSLVAQIGYTDQNHFAAGLQFSYYGDDDFITGLYGKYFYSIDEEFKLFARINAGLVNVSTQNRNFVQMQAQFGFLYTI